MKMRLFNIILIIFLLSAFAIGISISGETEWNKVDSSINNASNLIQNITLVPASYSNSKIDTGGFYLVIEKYVHFVGSLAMETMRTGIKFGYDNPSYFTPENIIYVIKIIIWALIISLLIKPLFYICIFIIMFFIWLKDKLKRKKRIKDKELPFINKLTNKQ